jgi:hypothetical protein
VGLDLPSGLDRGAGNAQVAGKAHAHVKSRSPLPAADVKDSSRSSRQLEQARRRALRIQRRSELVGDQQPLHGWFTAFIAPRRPGRGRESSNGPAEKNRVTAPAKGRPFF